MIQLRSQTFDDRGQDVRLITESKLIASDFDLKSLSENAGTQSKQEIHDDAKFYLIGGVVFACFMVIGGVFSERLAKLLGITGTGAFLLAMLLWAPFYPILSHLHHRSSARKIIRILRANSICPCCTYSLTEIQAQPDGCTVCPECGAAWRLPAPSTATTPET